MDQYHNAELLKETLKNILKPEHYEHSLRTAETAKQMAHAYGVDEDKAYLAGLLHDYTKSFAPAKLISEAERLGIEINSAERLVPYLLHAKVGARLVESDLKITDKELLSAIEKHTFGATSMTRLDKIVYVADIIEPGRSYAGLDALRQIAFDGLDEVFKAAYMNVVEHLVKAKKVMHPVTVEVWNKLVSE